MRKKSFIMISIRRSERVISKLDMAKSNETDNKLKLMGNFCVFFIRIVAVAATATAVQVLYLRFIGQIYITEKVLCSKWSCTQ